MILKDEFETWHSTQDHKGETNVFELDSDGEYMSLLTWSAYDDFKARNTSAPEGSAMSDKPAIYVDKTVFECATQSYVSSDGYMSWTRGDRVNEADIALYPASVVEALKAENEAQAKLIEALETLCTHDYESKDDFIWRVKEKLKSGDSK